MSTTLIRTMDSGKLSKMLHEAHIELSPREVRAIDQCHSMSFTTWLGYNDGALVCAWGIIPPSILSDEVYLWLHATDAVKANQFLFIRRSQIVVQNLLMEYRAITGHVKADAKSSKKWLKWLGAEFGPMAPNGLVPFRIERHG